MNYNRSLVNLARILKDQQVPRMEFRKGEGGLGYLQYHWDNQGTPKMDIRDMKDAEDKDWTLV